MLQRLAIPSHCSPLCKTTFRHAVRMTTALCLSATVVLGATSANAQDAPVTPPEAGPQSDPLGAPTLPVGPEVAPPEDPARGELAPEEDSNKTSPEAPSGPEVPVTNPNPVAPGDVRLAPLVESEPECRCDDEEDAEGSGAFLIGVGLFDLSELNDRLADNGYEELQATATLIGGEGHGVMDSGFVAGIRGAAILYPDGNGPGSYQTSLAGGFGMLDLGFALVRKRHILLTLTGGIGGYGWSLDISDRASADFDAALSDPARSTSMGRGGLLTGLTVGFDGRVPVGPVERGRQGFFTMGARISALYGPPIGSVSFEDDADVDDAPAMNLVGVYGALTIGFGGQRQ